MLLNRRRSARIVFGGAVAYLTGACGVPPVVPTPTAVNPLIKPRATGADLTTVRATTELAVGRNRFAVGLLDARNQGVTQGNVLVEFFKLGKNNSAQKRGEAPATFRGLGGASKGIWVAMTSFDEPGSWSAQITLNPASNPNASRINFEVQEKFSTPGYGDAAPRSTSPVAADVGGDVSHICSNSPPCALHSISIARALQDAQKPVVVLFATPALCTSATCAPELEIVEQLRARYAERANFVHVEIYQYPFDGTRVAQTVTEWRLNSDPWTFLLDKNGIVADRFEGPAPIDELEPSLRGILA